MKTFSVYVPARLGSERLHKKALKDFNGVPLIQKILGELKKSKIVTKFCVNTEDESIANVTKEFGVSVYKRREELAHNETTTEEILLDFVECCNCDYVAAINPTNPLLRVKTIDKFFHEVMMNNYDTSFSVTKIKKHLILNNKPINYSSYGPHPRTQDVKAVYSLNWAIVCWKTELVKRKIKKRGDSIYLGKIGFIEIPEIEAIDIDTALDFDIALAVDKRHKKFFYCDL